MKHSLIATAILSSTILFSSLVCAEETEQLVESQKKWNVGISTYAITIDAAAYGDDQFAGYSLSGGYSFSDNVALRGQYYSTEHDIDSSLELSGLDLNVYVGTGLASEGFKAYAGLGVYSETLESSYFQVEEDFSGVQLSGGIGYNWESVSLDFALAIRSTGDYEDFGTGADTSAVAGSLILAYRF